MSAEIVNQETDMAGKYRVWVETAENELTMLKFGKEPTNQMINDEIDKVKKSKDKVKELELYSINQQIEALTKRKEILEKEIKEDK